MPPTPTVPTLTDGVVTLRAHRASDAEAVWEQCQDPLSQEWTTVPVPYPRELAERFVRAEMAAGWAVDEEWAFAIEVDGPEGPRYGGTCSLRNERDGRAEIAYGSHPAIRGTGAVERALRLLLEWGFTEQGLHTVIWWADRGNWASRRTAWRLGFAVEGQLRQWLPHRGELREAWVGTLLRDDPREPHTPWLANPAVVGDGVRLRPFTWADVPRLVEGLGDAATQYWLAFVPRDPGPSDALAFLETVQERLATGHTVTWAFCADGEVGAGEGDDRLLGVVGLYRLGDEPEVGYWTHPDARGRGLTRRAAAAALDHAFTVLGLHRVAAYASSTNAASLAVLDALGMHRTGVRRAVARTGAGERLDLVGYDLLAAEWSAEWSAERTAAASTTNPARASATPISSGDR